MRHFALTTAACALAVLFTTKAVEPLSVHARPISASVSDSAAAAGADPSAPIDGFSDASARTERDWEVKFRAMPDPANLRAYMERIAARPHNVGTAYDRQNAEWILSLFQQWGWDAHIENFDVLFPTPEVRIVELLEPTSFKAGTRGTHGRGRPHFQPARGAAPYL